MSENHHSDDKGWADNPKFIRLFLGVLIISCIGAALAGFVPAFQPEHPHFEQEGWKVFFAVYGFLAFSFIVLAGQHLRKLVGKKEDYYEERE